MSTKEDRHTRAIHHILPIRVKAGDRDSDEQWTDADAREHARKRGKGRRDPSHFSEGDDSEGYDGGEHHELDL